MGHLTKFFSIPASCSLFKWLALACVAPGILYLSSCSGKNDVNKNVFHYNEQTGIASLDPAFAKNQSVMWAIHQVYNTLVETDSQLNIVPSIARSWELSEDRKTYTFYIRNDVYFHDDSCFTGGRGRKLNANDVAYSFTRLIDKKTASAGAWVFNDKVDALKPFSALNDSVFDLHLTRPYQPVIGIFA